MTRLGDRTQASSIVRALVAATSPAAGPMSPTLRTEAFADQAVGPTLATAGFGLLVGDLTAVGAILRPDYATGPGLAFPLETLRDAALCARRGIVVRRPDVFERLARVDLIVLDDDPALSRVELEVTGVQTQTPGVGPAPLRRQRLPPPGRRPRLGPDRRLPGPTDPPPRPPAGRFRARA